MLGKERSYLKMKYTGVVITEENAADYIISFKK